VLNVPEGFDLVTFIPVGYPAAPLPPGERKPLSEVLEIIE
jgi:hypothetical protein